MTAKGVIAINALFFTLGYMFHLTDILAGSIWVISFAIVTNAIIVGGDVAKSH